MEHIIQMLYDKGRDHRTAIRETVALTNMLKARVRIYVGFNALRVEGSEALDKDKLKQAYKRLLEDRADPDFIAGASRILDPCDQGKEMQKKLAKEMGDLAKQLPIWAWAEKQPGCGAPLLGKIIAEAGRDLSAYSTPAKLWKRFGLAVVNGKAPKPEKGKELGFSQYRRSVAYQLGECLLRSGGSEEKGNLSYWKRLYLRRKEFEIRRAQEQGKSVVPAARIKKGEEHLYMSEGHVHNRAMRYMTKAFLKALWEEWTDSRDSKLPEFLQAAE